MADHNDTRRERLLKWLQDAYAMEQEAETMMKAMASRIENYPSLLPGSASTSRRHRGRPLPCGSASRRWEEACPPQRDCSPA